MRKRLTLLLVLVCCSITLSGCSLNDMFNDIKASWGEAAAAREHEKLRGDITDLVSNYSLTDSTKGALQGVLTANDNYLDVSSTSVSDYKILGSDLISNLAAPFIGSPSARRDKDISKAKSALRKAQTNADAALMNDELYVAQKQDEQSPGSNQDKSKKGFIVVVVVVVVLLLLLFLFLNKRAHKPKVKAVAPVKPMQPALPKHEVNVAEVKQVDANKMNACRKLGQKFGVDADKELVKYNGDVDKLYRSLIAMTPLDD